jgi:nitrogen fixation/metabolism regulation signal transduction histidine kinase
MDGLFDSYISSNSLALIVSSIIFVVTVTLVAKQLINFVITAVLLFFAVVSGFAIANNDIVRSYFQGSEQSSAKAAAAGEKMEESRLDTIKEHISQIFQQLVETLSNQSKDHQGDKEKSKQLKSSIESVINQLEQQRLQLQEFLDAQSEAGLGR